MNQNSDLDDRGAVTDLVAVANTGLNCRRIVQCNENTLNTPYKAGLTAGRSGTAYVNMSSADYGTLLYVVSGTNRMFLRSKDNGTWGDWEELLKNVDLDGRFVVVGNNTAMQTTQAATMYRIQISSVGNLSLFKSTDGGKTWPQSKAVASFETT